MDTSRIARVVPCSVHWLGVDTGLHSRAPGAPLGWLTPAERDRRDRMRSVPARARFVTGRALIRQVLSGLTGAAPRDIVLVNPCATCGKDHGRPSLPGSGFDFSLSHSGNLVGLAVVSSGPHDLRRVGLDVESVGTRDAPDVGDLVLGEAERAYSGAGDPAAFLRTWTRKEAVVKAIGTGLHTDLRTITLTGPAQPPRVLAWPGPGPAPALADVPVRTGYSAAVCVLDAVPDLDGHGAPRPLPAPEFDIVLVDGTPAPIAEVSA